MKKLTLSLLALALFAGGVAEAKSHDKSHDKSVSKKDNKRRCGCVRKCTKCDRSCGYRCGEAKTKKANGMKKEKAK